MKKTFVLWILVALLGLSACAPLIAHAANPTPAAPQPQPLPDDQHAFQAVRATLAGQLGVDPQTISLVDVQPAEWSDSCLGLGGPAESCAAVITPGFHVQVTVAGTNYEFRTDQAAEVIRPVK